MSQKYLSGDFAFLCQEDILVNAALIEQALNIDEPIFGVSVDQRVAFPWREPESLVNAAELEHWVNQQTRDLPEEKLLCVLIDGDDCGCCGNYEGTCYFCSAVCLAHDVACAEDCSILGSEWACGPDCQPGC